MVRFAHLITGANEVAEGRGTGRLRAHVPELGRGRCPAPTPDHRLRIAGQPHQLGVAPASGICRACASNRSGPASGLRRAVQAVATMPTIVSPEIASPPPGRVIPTL